MSFKTYPSGSSKRRRAKPIEKLVQAQKGDIHNGVSINSNDELATILNLISMKRILTPTLAIAM